MRTLTIRSTLFLFFIAQQVFAEPWARHTIDASSQGADGARLADFNGDGLLDIVTPWEEGGAIRIAFHPGVERVTQPWPSVEVGRVGNPEDAMAMDVDGDGRLDVVSACEGNTRSIYVHWAPDNPADLMKPGAWRTELLPASEKMMQFMFSVPMDVNQDGRMDLVSGGKNADAKLGWFEAPKHPRDLDAWEWHEIMPLGWLMSLQVVPSLLNARNGLSLMVSDRRGKMRGVYQLEPVIKGRFKKRKVVSWQTFYIGGQEHEVMFMDVSRGAMTHCILQRVAWAVRGGDVIIRPCECKKSKIHIPMPPNSGSGKAVALGDMDGDGDEDIVVTCEHSKGKTGVFYYARPEESKTDDPAAWTFHDIGGIVGTKFDRIELVDLDQDGDLDVITCEERENLGVIWYENPTK